MIRILNLMVPVSLIPVIRLLQLASQAEIY